MRSPVDPSLAQTDPGTPRSSLASEPPPLPPKAEPPSRRARTARLVKRVLLTTLVLFVLGTATVVGLFVYYGRKLPQFDSLKDYEPLQTTHVYAADGKTEVGEIFEERRTVIPYEQIPSVMIQALVSAEDKNFFEHHGLDYPGIVKAALHDMLPGVHKRGASTLTQQLVKTMLLSNERKLSRKIKEAILAYRLENKLSKEQILYLYLNQIYFGHRRYGVEEAARYYFGKHAKDLTVGEAALLASVPKDPNRINPKGDLKRVKERQTYVLNEMVKNGYISRAVADREIAKPIVTAPEPATPPGAYYVEEVRRILEDKFGEQTVDGGGLRVETMMDADLQAAGEQAMKDGLEALDKRQGWRGADGSLDDDLWARLRPLVQARLDKKLASHARGVDAGSVLDLSLLVDEKKGDAPDDKALASLAARVSFEPREVGTEVVARVEKVRRDAAILDLGTVEATLPLATTKWARKFNPALITAAPRTMSDVVDRGDLVRVRLAKVSGDKVEVALEQLPKVQGALVSIDPRNRGVLALVGGYDARLSPYDRATQAKRQPGSSFKPFVYATALEVGQARALLPDTAPEEVRKRCLVFQPQLLVYDTPEPIRDKFTGKMWNPQNFERGEFDGPITMRKALAESKNTVAVKLIGDIGCEPSTPLSFDDMQQHGLDRVKDTAHKAGIDSAIPDSVTAALGTGEVKPIELVNAYATLAMEGRYAPPVLVKRVLSSTGEVLYQDDTRYDSQPPLLPGQPPLPEHPRGLRADVSFETLQVMRSVVEDPDGTARSMQALGRPIAGKTGTASDQRDAWFIGFTPEVVAGAWVGFDDHTVLGSRETGAHAAGPIWLGYMKAAEDKLPHTDWPMPAGIVTAQIDPRNGLLADPHSPFVETEYYLAGTEPKTVEPPEGEATTTDFFRSQGP